MSNFSFFILLITCYVSSKTKGIGLKRTKFSISQCYLLFNLNEKCNLILWTKFNTIFYIKNCIFLQTHIRVYLFFGILQTAGGIFKNAAPGKKAQPSCRRPQSQLEHTSSCPNHEDWCLHPALPTPSPREIHGQTNQGNKIKIIYFITMYHKNRGTEFAKPSRMRGHVWKDASSR